NVNTNGQQRHPAQQFGPDLDLRWATCIQQPIPLQNIDRLSDSSTGKLLTHAVSADGGGIVSSSGHQESNLPFHVGVLDRAACEAHCLRKKLPPIPDLGGKAGEGCLTS